MPDDVTRLRGTSDRLLERELFVCTVSELELLQSVGEASSDSVFGDGPPRLFWDLEWPCGLVMALEFDQLTQRLTGHLDAPEAEHAIRHLGIEPRELWLLEVERPDKFAEQADPPERSYTVWKTDEHGVKTKVASGLSQRDARCWQAELAAEHRDHEYWVQHDQARAPSAAAEPDGINRQLIERLGRRGGDPAAGGADDDSTGA